MFLSDSFIYFYSDQELLRRAGPDGLLYISFERHMIILTAMMTMAALCIALPINFFQGNLQGDKATFGHTTMSNIDPTSGWVWVHTLLVLSYLPVGCYVMRRFMKQVRRNDSTSIITQFLEHGRLNNFSKISGQRRETGGRTCCENVADNRHTKASMQRGHFDAVLQVAKEDCFYFYELTFLYNIISCWSISEKLFRR